MRTPTSTTRQPCGSAGFTLVELLAVVAILALAISAFVYSGPKSLETAGFRSLMLKTAAALSEGRTKAIRQARDQVFVIDLGARRMGLADGRTVLEWPPSVDVKATVAKSESQSGVAGIRFYPSGSSSGGTVTFGFRNLTYEVRVNWLTGNVTLIRV